MSAISNASKETITAPESQGESAAAAARRRRIVVNSLRVLLLVVIIGGWQLATSVGIVDKFFWGQPSGIWAQLLTWVTHGTAQGPLCGRIASTFVEPNPGSVTSVALACAFVV